MPPHNLDAILKIQNSNLIQNMHFRSVIKFAFILSFSFILASILCFFFILAIIPISSEVDYDDEKAAEDWVKAAAKADNLKNRFECLEMALHLYSTTSPKRFNWRYILAELNSLHQECGLQIKEERLVNYCYQKDTDALELIDQCIEQNLILYNKYGNRYDSSLLRHLLITILSEQQNNKDDYVDKAVKLMIKAIKKGADFRPFYSICDPLSESKLIDDIINMNNYEAFKVIVDYKAVPHFILSSETTKQKVLRCGNEQIIQYYLKMIQ